MKHSLRLTALLIAFSTAGCNSCGNEISQSVASPSGDFKAVVFNRNCGATTGFNTQVSIIPAAGSLPNSGGNTLVLDDAIPVQLEWRSESALHLDGLGSSAVFKQETKVGGVSVSYDN